MNTYPETPDAWIERNDHCGNLGPPNRDGACMVCDKIDCECEGDDPQ